MILGCIDCSRRVCSTLRKSSNRSPTNFNILVKLKTAQTIHLFQTKVLYSQNIIMIDSVSRVSAIQRWVPSFCKVTSKNPFKSLNSGKHMENAVFSATIWFVKLHNLFLIDSISSSIVKPHCHMKTCSCYLIYSKLTFQNEGTFIQVLMETWRIVCWL